MHGNTIHRKVWSHTANSGKLFFVTEGLRGQSKWGLSAFDERLFVALRDLKTSDFLKTEGEECRM
jgi:hypothetical protein